MQASVQVVPAACILATDFGVPVEFDQRRSKTGWSKPAPSRPSSKSKRTCSLFVALLFVLPCLRRWCPVLRQRGTGRAYGSDVWYCATVRSASTLRCRRYRLVTASQTPMPKSARRCCTTPHPPLLALPQTGMGQFSMTTAHGTRGWVGHVTTWVGRGTKWVGHVTTWVGRGSKWVGHGTKWVGHWTTAGGRRVRGPRGLPTGTFQYHHSDVRYHHSECALSADVRYGIAYGSAYVRYCHSVGLPRCPL
eukprot:173092-Rhodomonas_salina.1